MGKALGRGEGRRPGRVGEVGIAAVKLVAHTQVGELHQSVGRDAKQIAGLDVAMDDLLVVNCNKRRELFISPGKDGINHKGLGYPDGEVDRECIIYNFALTVLKAKYDISKGQPGRLLVQRRAGRDLQDLASLQVLKH